MSRYLFISPHIDDSDIACGATIALLIERGHDVEVITLSHVYEKIDLSIEWVASMETLGVTSYSKMDFQTRHFDKHYDEILQHLFSINENHDFIFAPSPSDFHADHSTVGRACERVFKNNNLITYQHPWNSREIKTNYFVEVEKQHIEKKIEALACYKSQQHRTYMSKDYIWASAINSGVQCGRKFAEGFEVINYIA